MVHEHEEAFNLFVRERRMRVFRLSLQNYLTGMLLGTSSRLKKVIYIVLLVVLFSNIVWMVTMNNAGGHQIYLNPRLSVLDVTPVKVHYSANGIETNQHMSRANK
ncbi:FAD/NAD(P)-binding domain protein [Artemisia annua]|uniref:FAD/NAD(P)-binding domain protein n=1 Tax=Artemisia annua TaxID=35608 RepID=A0A2U1KWD3_ARTAN|nr:FAD/NAD(P)-binding domain protein [Artemisia annua]